jgi:hypothetical protein
MNSMQALKDENYELAFDLCAPNIQEELGSAEGLQEFIESADRQPEKWNSPHAVWKMMWLI